jgi:5-hydroxyisourate hydrolase-like protein (transthyretin family)
MSILGTALLALVMQALPLQGVVVKKGSTEPISKATVELRRDQDNSAILDSMTTEDDGRFSFGNVAPGRYRLTVTRRGYTRPPLPITVAAGQPPQSIQLNMAPTGSISGRVVDPVGRPMGNVEVKAMRASYPEGRRVLMSVQSVLTNDLGEYRLFWLAPGRYYVSAVHPQAQGMSRRMSSAGFSMSVGGAIVSTGKGDPAISGPNPIAQMEAQSERYAPIFFGGTTDEQAASGIDLREAAEFGGVNFVVGPLQPRHVRGVVIDGLTGRPAQYGSITLPKDPEAAPRRESDVDHETGRFDLLLFPGSYTLTANSASGEGFVSFILGDADIDLTIPTTPTFDIRGRIIVEGGTLSAAALEALHITLRRDPPRGEAVIPSYSTALPDGSFTIPASAGDYRINMAPILNVTPSRFPSPLWASLQAAYVKSMRLGTADILNAPLHLDRQPSATLEVVIAMDAGELEGQVLKDGREPAADASVFLLPNLRRRNELYQTTNTDAAGRFHFDHVPPGDYKVFSWEEIEDGAWYDAEFMKGVESRGKPVHINPGQTETARIEVIP